MNTSATPLSTTAIATTPRLADLVALTKPRITFTVLATTMSGFFLGHKGYEGRTLAATIAGTILVVGGANALNMYLERESDRYMKRTSERPLPAGRMNPGVALFFGLGLTLVALLVLTFAVNPAAGMLAAIANTSYVLLYTPLKPRSSVALWVGAVPGAIPPLLGWAASTGGVNLTGLSLFTILFFWQIPHFHAIALFRQEEYARAGLKVLPLERGDVVTRQRIAFWSLVLLAVSLVPFTLGLVSAVYLAAALVLGLPFVALALRGLRAQVDPRWAHRVFGFSIPYLVALFAALLATRVSLFDAPGGAR
jgi:protoheme IX farnesyltransferase